MTEKINNLLCFHLICLSYEVIFVWELYIDTCRNISKGRDKFRYT